MSQIPVPALDKMLQVIKDLPLWLFIGISISSIILYFSLILPQIEDWILSIGIVSTVLAICNGISRYISYRQSQMKLRKTFHLTPVPSQSFWICNKQPDNSVVTQLTAQFMVKNCTNRPVHLVDARIKKSLAVKEIERIQAIITVHYREIRQFSTDLLSGDIIYPNLTLPMSLCIIFRGVLPKKVTNKLKAFKTKLYLFDSDGNKQSTKITFYSMLTPKPQKQRPPLEVPSLTGNAIEKEIVSILQSELNRYAKCGRSVGGLGSICIIIPGRKLTGVGMDLWKSDSPENQSISSNPEAATIDSDNLETLLIFYHRLNIENEKEQFIEYLLNRIHKDKGDLSISYFIVCALWKLGYLCQALNKVKSALSLDEAEEFGFSNVLMLLNGILYYQHPSFTSKELDFVEQFIFELNGKIYTFKIAEKINAIRAFRLRIPNRAAAIQ